MKDLPTPILGQITAFTITTRDLEASLACYKMLGYKELFRADWPFKWIQITDGVVLIMLREDAKHYLALTYYTKDIAKVVSSLEQKGITFEVKPQKNEPVKRYLMRSPDGLPISLVNIIDGFTQPAGPGMLQMEQADYFKPEKYVNKVCGLFGELAQPVADLEASIAFWEVLGFRVLSRFETPYAWVIMSDGLAIVGLHQSAHFAAPAITYFAADSQAKIAALKKAGLSGITTQGPANAVITTPEQQQIFLFSFGVADAGNKTIPEINTDTIETERLTLTAITPDVYKVLFSAYSDEAIMEFLGMESVEQLEAERQKWEGGMTTYRTSFVRFLLKERLSGRVIGLAGFHNWYAMHSRAELGYAMEDSTKMNQGFMKEAIKAIIAYGFDKMGLNRIEAFVGAYNEPSLRLVKGNGFTEEGRLRMHYCKNGTLEDSICFGLLKEEYDARK